MAEDKKLSKKAQPIADVEAPGTSAPSSTSKPVLVSNRPIMQDPMMTTEQGNSENAPEEPKENLVVKGSSKAVIQPLESSPKAEAAAQPTETAPENTEKPDEAEPNAEDTKTDDAAKDKKAGKSPAEAQEAEAAREAERQASLQKIVDAKTYFLPINAVEKRKTRRFIVLGVILALVLALAWVDIALDASLIHIDGVKAVTHFFSN